MKDTLCEIMADFLEQMSQRPGYILWRFFALVVISKLRAEAVHEREERAEADKNPGQMCFADNFLSDRFAWVEAESYGDQLDVIDWSIEDGKVTWKIY